MIMCSENYVSIDGNKLTLQAEVCVIIRKLSELGAIDKDDAIDCVNTAFMTDEEIRKQNEEFRKKIAQKISGTSEKISDIAERILNALFESDDEEEE